MHTHQWVASFGNPGNGQYREELRRAKTTIQEYIKAHGFSAERTLVRLDGQYGTGAVVSDLGDFAYVTRGKDYNLLDRADVQARLHLPADQHLSSAESGICRALYDCPAQQMSENGPLVRIIVAIHPALTQKPKKRQVGLIRNGVVYELFLTKLPQNAFTASSAVRRPASTGQEARRCWYCSTAASKTDMGTMSSPAFCRATAASITSRIHAPVAIPRARAIARASFRTAVGSRVLKPDIAVSACLPS